MTTDNRTNETTPEQVDAAAKALAGIPQETPWSSCEVWGDLDEWVEGHRSRARAALVAAQGAAPRPAVERLDLARHYWRSQGYDYDLHSLDGNNDYEMGLAVADAALAALAAAQGAATQAESPVQAFADWHERWWRNEPNEIAKANAQAAFFAGWDARGAVSVLPSSGVDEDALAEVERAAAARALEEFAQAQDSWCEQGRAEQVISRAAMRDALRARAEAYRREGKE